MNITECIKYLIKQKEDRELNYKNVSLAGKYFAKIINNFIFDPDLVDFRERNSKETIYEFKYYNNCDKKYEDSEIFEIFRSIFNKISLDKMSYNGYNINEKFIAFDEDIYKYLEILTTEKEKYWKIFKESFLKHLKIKLKELNPIDISIHDDLSISKGDYRILILLEKCNN